MPEFAWRRLVRIVPLYWMLTLVEAAMIWHSRLDESGGQLSVGQVLKSLFFVPYFNGADKIRPVLSVGWSLDFEMLFYAVFAVAMFFPLRRGLAVIMAVFAGLIGLGIVWAQHPGAPEVLRAWTSPILLEFLIGVGLGVGFLRLGPGWSAPRLPALPIALALVLFEAAYLAWLAPGKGVDLGWRPVFWAIAALVVASALFTRQSDGRGLVARTMLLLGDASYAIYLVHPIVLALIIKAMSIAHIRGGLWLALVPVGFAASSAAGVAVHLWVERPVNRRLRWPGRDHGAGLAPANP